MILQTNAVFDFIDRSRNYGSVDQLTKDFQNLIRTIGFDYFIMAATPISPAKFSSHIFASTWPVEWVEHYKEMEYCRIDPILHFSMSQERPSYWREALCARPDRKTQQLTIEARSFGLADGLLFPLYSNSIGRNMISISSNHTVPVDHQVASVLYLASSYFSAAISDASGQSSGNMRLTDREREVLSWAAAGKTAWETSEILSISERTVQGHLAAARQKLDVATTTQAAAKAFKIGLIAF